MKPMEVNITSKWKNLKKEGKYKDNYLLQNNSVYIIMPE